MGSTTDGQVARIRPGSRRMCRGVLLGRMPAPWSCQPVAGRYLLEALRPAFVAGPAVYVTVAMADSPVSVVSIALRRV